MNKRKNVEGLVDIELILDFMRKNKLSKVEFSKFCGISTRLLSKF